MTSRRQALALAGSTALSLMTGSLVTRAATSRLVRSRLATRMFNFDISVPTVAAETILAKLKELAILPGIAGFMVGKNLSPTPFPTRFEWIYLIQFDVNPAGTLDPTYRRFELLRTELTSLCRNHVDCDLTGEFPTRYADGPGVTIRHTVMFDFKPDAPRVAQERIVSAIRRMGTLPMVQHYRVDRSSAAPDPNQMQWQVIGDFASLADYQAYSDAPVHRAIRDDFTAHTSRVAFLDAKV